MGDRIGKNTYAIAEREGINCWACPILAFAPCALSSEALTTALTIAADKRLRLAWYGASIIGGISAYVRTPYATKTLRELIPDALYACF